MSGQYSKSRLLFKLSFINILPIFFLNMNNLKIPRSKTNDYTKEIADQRVSFLQEKLNTSFEHITQYSFDPNIVNGNIENFIGVAQIPLGIAGPLLINGEHAQGEFLIPMATSEGTLVASYNRGMKLTNLAGGVTTTVIDDKMQRAPLFIFKNARYARKFGVWIDENFNSIKAEAEKTTSIGRLKDIEQYSASKMRWLRFNYFTGDAAGQNMVTKATRHACQWILDQKPEGLEHFTLAANFDTDKKHSMVNGMMTRGKRVVAEVTIPAEIIKTHFRTTPQILHSQRQMSNMGSMISGSVNNGSHSANGLTAMFIATGQDIANIAESSAGYIYGDINADGDYYFSITIPALIVATYGGGTGLATQKECLEILGCNGSGKVNKLAEIMAAVVLCGELSLSAAVVSDEWVSSHESYGRNR